MSCKPVPILHLLYWYTTEWRGAILAVLLVPFGEFIFSSQPFPDTQPGNGWCQYFSSTLFCWSIRREAEQGNNVLPYSLRIPRLSQLMSFDKLIPLLGFVQPTGSSKGTASKACRAALPPEPSAGASFLLKTRATSGQALANASPRVQAVKRITQNICGPRRIVRKESACNNDWMILEGYSKLVEF